MNIKNIAFLISCLSLNSTYNNNDVLCLNLNRMNAKTITQISPKPIVRQDKLLPELDTTTFDTREEYDISLFRIEPNSSNSYSKEYKGLVNDIYLFKENYCSVFKEVAHCIYGEPILDNIRVKNKKVSQYKGLGFIENKNFEIPDEVFVTFRLKNSINIPIATLQCASIEPNNDRSLSLTFDVTNSVSFEYSNMEEMATKYGTTITASYGGNIGANVGIDKFVEVSGQKSFDVESSFSQEFTKTVAISKTLTFMVNSGLSYQFNPNNTYDSTQYISLNARAKFTPYIVATFRCNYETKTNGQCFMGKNYGYKITNLTHLETKATFVPTSTLFTRIDKYLDSESGDYWEYLNPDNTNENIIFM